MRKALKDVFQYCASQNKITDIRIDSGPKPLKDKDGNPKLDDEGNQLMSPDVTKVFTRVKDNSITIDGIYHKAWPEIRGTLGIGDLGLFKWMLNADFLAGEGSDISVINDEDGEPRYIEFKGADGQKAKHLLLMPSMINSALKRMRTQFPDSDWLMTVDPDQAAVKKFVSSATAFQSVLPIPVFTLETVDGELVAGFGGNSGGHSMKVSLGAAENPADIQPDFKWSIPDIIPVLKLSENSVSTRISVRDMGVSPLDEGEAIMRIVIDSGLASWNYLITPINGGKSGDRKA